MRSSRIISQLSFIDINFIKVISTLSSLYHATICGSGSLLFSLNIIGLERLLMVLTYSKFHFIYDTILNIFIYDRLNFFIYLVHHIVSYIGVSKVVYYIEQGFINGNMNEYENIIINGVTLVLTSEIPIILMNINYILYKKGYKKTGLFYYLDTTYVFLYFIFRVCNMFIIANIYTGYGYDIAIWLILVLNYVWFYIIAKRYVSQHYCYGLLDKKVKNV